MWSRKERVAFGCDCGRRQKDERVQIRGVILKPRLAFLGLADFTAFKGENWEVTRLFYNYSTDT